MKSWIIKKYFYSGILFIVLGVIFILISPYIENLIFGNFTLGISGIGLLLFIWGLIPLIFSLKDVAIKPTNLTRKIGLTLLFIGISLLVVPTSFIFLFPSNWFWIWLPFVSIGAIFLFIGMALYFWVPLNIPVAIIMGEKIPKFDWYLLFLFIVLTIGGYKVIMDIIIPSLPSTTGSVILDNLFWLIFFFWIPIVGVIVLIIWYLKRPKRSS